MWQEAGWLGWGRLGLGPRIVKRWRWLRGATIASQRHNGGWHRVIWQPGREEVIWEHSLGAGGWYGENMTPPPHTPGKDACQQGAQALAESVGGSGS